MTKAIKVYHFVPDDGIGGVQLAASSFGKSEKVDYRIVYMRTKGSHPLLGYSKIFQLIRDIETDNAPIFVYSLWKSCVLGLFLRFWFYDCKHILFLHSAKNAHLLDALVTNMFSRIVQNVFADSTITARDRLAKNVKSTKIISMLRYSGEDLMLLRGPRFKTNKASLKMIYWGRLHPIKNLIFSVKLVEFLRRKGLDVYFSIVGPMTSYGKQVVELVKTLGLEGFIKFHDEKDLTEIAVMSREYSFYLSTSRHEGQAMSVVEGMQLGLIPVVTPVGEIGNYCRNSHNSLFVNSSGVNDNLELVAALKDTSRFDDLSKNACVTWKEHLSYGQSMESALIELNQLEAR